MRKDSDSDDGTKYEMSSKGAAKMMPKAGKGDVEPRKKLTMESMRDLESLYP